MHYNSHIKNWWTDWWEEIRKKVTRKNLVNDLSLLVTDSIDCSLPITSLQTELQKQQQQQQHSPQHQQVATAAGQHLDNCLPQVSEEETIAVSKDHNESTTTPCGSPKQKNSSRRNAWGNLSYADLITQAIKSSPDQRLTLSQIYEWVVKNVPYFKDKGDSTSSSGWKVHAHKFFLKKTVQTMHWETCSLCIR